jgi:hypothetical protein
MMNKNAENSMRIHFDMFNHFNPLTAFKLRKNTKEVVDFNNTNHFLLIN